MLVNPLMQIAIESWGAIICILFAIFICIDERKNDKTATYLLIMVCQIAVLLIGDSLAIYYRGNLSTLGYYIVRISNYSCFALNATIEITAGLILKNIIGTKDRSGIKHWFEIASSLCTIDVVVLTISQFTGFAYYFDDQNRYHRAQGLVVITTLSFSIIILLLYVTVRNYKQIESIQIKAFLFLFVSTIVSEFFQVLFYGISLVYISLTIGMLIMLLTYQRERVLISIKNERKLFENKMLLMEKQKELDDKTSKLMLSQIQPHFIFNTLSAISSLCVFDPDTAKKTTDNFAVYLRRNLDSLGNVQLIPFSQELEHVKAYLAIEKVRFEDELNVEYDIQFKHFKIPPLTLQPMVENAVKHGIRAREDGGTVSIKTEQVGDIIRITIKDTGVGFNPSATFSDGRTHVGLENVTERLSLLCNGTLKIDSKLMVGTTVTIELPM